MDLALDPATDLQRYLKRVSEHWWGAQVFLFAGDGKHFWASRRRVSAPEIAKLRECLDYIEACESRQPKPFLSHSAELGATVAALGGWSDLYLVVLGVEPDRVAAEARLAADRDALESWVKEAPERRELLETSRSGAMSLAEAIGVR